MSTPADDPREWTAVQRAATLTVWLCEGRSFTLEEAAEQLGYSTPNSAWNLLDLLSRELPIYVEAGRWQLLPEYVEDTKRARVAARRREERKLAALEKAWKKVFDSLPERV